MTTGIRIEVSQDLYDKLVQVQEQHKKSLNRRPSLASIIIDICENALNNNENVHKTVHSEPQSVQNNVQNTVQKEKSFTSDALQERRLKQIEDYLTRWENSLREKELFLRDMQAQIFEEKEEIYQMKDDLLTKKDKFRQETLDGPEKIVEQKLLKYDVETKKKKIEELEKINRELKNELQQANERPKIIKEEKSFLDKVKDYLPLILGAAGLIGVYLLSKKEYKPKLPSHLEKLSGVFDQLDQKDKESLGNVLMNYANEHTIQRK